MTFFFSPESFNPLDGDHDHPLHAEDRTPQQATRFALQMRRFPNSSVRLETPEGDVVIPGTDTRRLFDVYLRRGELKGRFHIHLGIQPDDRPM